MAQSPPSAVAARAAWFIVALWLALPLCSLLPSAYAPVLFRGLVAALVFVAAIRPLAAIAIVAALGPVVVPLVVALGPPPFGGNGALEAMVAAVAAGIALRWGAIGALPAGRLNRPGLALIAVVALSGLLSLGAQQEQAGSLPAFLGACVQHAVHGYFSEPGRFPGWHEAAVWIDAILLAVMIERVVRHTEGAGRMLARMAAVGVLAEAAFSWLRLWQVAGRSDDVISAFASHAFSTRISPHFPDLNAIGSLFALGVVCWLAIGLDARRPRPAQVGALAGACVVAFALWLTGSRAAMAAAGATGIAVWWQLRRPSARTIILITLVCGAIGNAILTASQSQNGRASSATAMGIRLELAHVGLRMAADHPVLGVGLGEFRHQSTEYISPDLVARFPPAAVGENAHNQLIQVLGELGVVGLVVFIWYWIAVLGPSTAAIRAGSVEPWLLAWTAGLWAFHASALLGHPFLTPYVVFCVFVISGIVAGLTPEGAASRA